MRGGEDKGGSALTEEDEAEEEQGAGPAWLVWGLTDFRPSPATDWTSKEAPLQVSVLVFVWLASAATDPVASLFSLFFLPVRRRPLLTEEDEGEEAKEDVDVMELCFVFLGFNLAGLLSKEGVASRFRFSMLARSLLRLPSDRGSEQGLRNGDLLSLSLQKTTAIEPPTTELPDPPLVPPGPRRSMPIFPEPTDGPVVLLTPSLTKTDTFDCSLLFLPPSFFNLPERTKPFLLPLSLSFSLPIFLLLFANPRPEETVAEPVVTISEEVHLLFDRGGEEDSDWPFFLSGCGFFFTWCCTVFGFVFVLGLGTGGSGGRGAGGVSSKDG